jgi:ribose 5-phosphate isomerase A
MIDEHAQLKKAAAQRAIEYVRDGMTVGLGTGSTAEYALEGLAERVAKGLRIVGVPTSEKIASMARQLGITLSTLEECPEIDVTIDGADEVDLATLYAIKGRGGALLREKIVALSSTEEILMVDESKTVSRLGEHDPLPVEVIAFGWNRVHKELAALGCDPQLRKSPDGAPYRTDSGNYLLDCRFTIIDDPPTLATRIKSITGVVEHGLFIDIATRVIIAHRDGVRIVERGVARET